MAKNNFTFQTALKLNSAGFKKGVKEVQSALNSLKSSFLTLAGALGAGLGFTQLISNLKDTAVQLSVAKSTLENVSKTTKTFETEMGAVNVEITNYAENLEFVKRLSRDYSQDLVSLTENFAQFHAACEGTNLSLENQKMVFESLTKAAAYYHMSADRSKDMMTAITQMMSKGKVSAEELRRQLGNALPGAFNLMAAAMGVSTAQLEDMMKKGQVVSAEVLPKFAAMLNQVTQNANFDSLQMSMNKLRNTWYELVDNSGAEGLFKGVIEGSNKVLTVLSNNIRTIKSSLKGIAAGILAFSGFKWLTSQGDKFVADTEKNLKRLHEAKMKWFRESYVMGGQPGATPGLQSLEGIPGTPLATGNYKIMTKDELQNLKEYNQTVIQIAKNRRDLLVPMTKEWKKQQEIVREGKAINREINKQLGATKALIPGVLTLKKAWAGVVSTVKSIGAALKANAIMMIVSAILGAISSMRDYFKQIKEETKRIGSIFSDYQNEMKQVEAQTDSTNRKLQAQLSIIQDTNKEFATRKRALEDINKTLGLTGDNAFGVDALDKTKQAYKDIVNVVEQWIKASTTLAKVQAHAAAGAQAEADIIRLNAQIEAKRLRLREISTGKGADENGNTVYGAKSPRYLLEFNRLNKEIQLAETEIDQLRRVSKSADEVVTELYNDYYGLMSGSTQNNGGGGDKVETELSKVVEKFNKDKKELEHKLREHAITQEEYNQELNKLVQKYWEEAAGTGQMSIDQILAKMDKGKTLTAMEKWYKDLYEAAQQAAFDATINAAAEAIQKATEDAIEEADKKLKDDLDEFIDKMEKATQADLEALLTDKPGKKTRDVTFDYKKTASDKQSEQLDIHNDYVKELEDAIDDIVSKYDNLADAAQSVQDKIAQWRQELSLAKKEAATMEEALKISKIQEDIDELKRSINDAVFGGIKNMASSLDRVIKGMETLKNTLEDTDSSGWEKFMAIFNELVQIVETFTTAIQTVQTIQKLSTQMDEAEAALIATKISLLEKELMLRQAIAAQKALDVKQTEKQAAANIAESATAKAAASAKAGEAVAGATASGAKLPFPYNLAAIAAGIAAVLAALAAMSKFANGGIVGGSSYSGDNQVVRVNSGELILNKQQQATLFKAIKSGNFGGGGNVQFKIRGTDLIGVMNNEIRRQRG